MSEEQQKTDQLMEEEAVSIRERRRKELEQTYTPDSYRVIRKELFAHLRDPAITIRDGSITFNAACITGLEGVIYIKLQISESLGKLTAESCDENDRNALRWCIAKDGKRKSRTMTCQAFTDLIYKTMGWCKDVRYKMLGYLINYQGRQLYIFDLKVPEQFNVKQKEILVDPGEYAQDPAQVPTPPVNTRKGCYSEEIANSFGPTVAEYAQQTSISEADGFISIGMLTGSTDQADSNKPSEESGAEYGQGRVSELGQQ